MNATPQSELEHQRKLLSARVGAKGSGALRYGAAMYCYNLGLISDDMLEIYRRCSKFDREDPIDLARFEGIAVSSFDAIGLSGTSA